MVLRAANAAAYPAETADPLNVDVFWAYADEPQNRRYAGTYPPNSKVKIPLATDLDRDVVVTTNSRSGVGVQQKNDAADAPSSTLQSEREQRKPVLGLINNTTNTQANIGVSFYPRHMRARRIKVASDAGFTNVIATYYEDVDKSAAETPRLPEVFRLIRAVPGSGTVTYYVKVAHSSFSTALRTEATQQLKLEALRWGPDSDPLTVTFADSNGAGGSTGTFNPFIATIDGYGGAPNTFLLTIPLTGETSGITGTDGGFSDHLGVWTGTGVLNYNFGLAVHRALNVVRANGFKNTVSAINVKTNENYFASGSAYTTTGSINSGQNTLTMPNNGHDFRIGQGISVAGAGVAGATLYTTIQAISNDLLTITLNANALTTVSGAAVAHDDQVAIQTAIDDAAAAGYRAVFLPIGTYRVRGLVLPGEVSLVGETQKATVVASATNAPIIDCSVSSFRCGHVENLRIVGSKTAGTSQIGLRLHGPTDMLFANARNLTIEKTGGTGLFVGITFSSLVENVFADDCEGWPIEVDSNFMPCITFVNVYAGSVSASHPVGWRIKRCQNLLMLSCNGINSVPQGSYWMVLGMKNGSWGDSANATASATLINCNVESFHTGGIQCLRGSSVQIDGRTTFAGHDIVSTIGGSGINNTQTAIPVAGDMDTLLFPASCELMVTEGANVEFMQMTSRTATTATVTRGTPAFSFTTAATVRPRHQIGIEYEIDSAGTYPTLAMKPTIADTCTVQDAPVIKYKKGHFIHANDLPPLQTLGEGPYATQDEPVQSFWNTTTARSEALMRADGRLNRIAITGTTTFNNPGPRVIQCNFTAPGTVNLWPPSLDRRPQPVTIYDAANNAGTHNITVHTNSGDYTINLNGGSITLFPNSVADAWSVMAVYPVTLPSNVVKKTGGGLTDFIPIFTADDTITAGPIYRIGGTTLVCKDSFVVETDNAKDCGGDGFNRFRDIFAARKFKAPFFSTPGANGLYGGSGDPEGSQTAEPGSIYLRTNGTWYRKGSGSGNTGWILQGASVSATGSGLADFLAVFTNDTTVGAGPIYRSGNDTFFKGHARPETHNAFDLGSASFKWRTAYFGTKVVSVLFEFLNGVTVTTGTGDPEGVVTAIIGSLYLRDDTGNVYRKTSNTAATGWTLLNTTDANTALSNLASVAINASLIANANNTLDLGSTGTRWRTGYFGTSLVTPLLALESRTDPGSPANGDAWTSSDRNAVSVRIAGQTEDVVTSMWRNSAAASFDTTLTETSLLADTGVGTKTLAANRLKVGNQVRVKLAGLYGTKASSPGNFTIKLKNGATTMVTISAFGLPTNVVDQNWWIEAVGTVTATGASGNILWTINFYYNDGTGTLKGRPYTVNSAIIDTTASKLIDVTGQFTVSDIANYWETTTASIELVA